MPISHSVIFFAKAALLTLVLLISACGGKPRHAQNGDAASDQAGWFCSTDESQWRCKKGEFLPSNPTQQTPLSLEQALLTPVFEQPEPAPQAIAESEPPPVASSAADKILALPDTHWTVQLAAFSTEQALRDYQRRIDLDETIAVATQVNQQRYFVLLAGFYDSQTSALAASKQLPTAVEATWVRSVKGLKKLLKP